MNVPDRVKDTGAVIGLSFLAGITIWTLSVAWLFTALLVAGLWAAYMFIGRDPTK